MTETPTGPLRVAYIGNFEPRHSTESHISRALENVGHTVTRIQENIPSNWESQVLENQIGDANFVLWTRTGWDWPNLGLTHAEAHRRQRSMLRYCRSRKIAVVGYHLDIWWGLNRSHLIFEEPFFEVDLLCTADGGHDKEWYEAHINHVWFPPGVSRDETEPGMFRDEYFSQVAFVGNWGGDYHAEHQHRRELVDFLRHNYRNRTNFYPEKGRPAVRNEDLRDLYASSKVNVGDSCFVGKIERYCSDRIPETLGRGGLLIHPRVHGITDGYPWDSPTGPYSMWREGEHLLCWEAGDWDELGKKIDWALEHESECKEIRARGREFTRALHTYERRMDSLVVLLMERDLL